MTSVVMSVWRGADIDCQDFQTEYIRRLKAMTSETSGLVRCEVYLLKRDVRASLGTMANGAPSHDLWVNLVFDDPGSWASLQSSGKLRELNDPGLVCWVQAAVVETTDALDASLRGVDDRPAEHKGIAPPAAQPEAVQEALAANGGYVMFGSICRHPELTHEQYLEHYKRVHWHYVPEFPSVVRYDAHLTVQDVTDGGLPQSVPPVADSYLLMVFPSEKHWLDDVSTPIGEAAVSDWKGFLWWVHFEEVEIVEVFSRS